MTENGLVITLGVLYDGKFIWLYGNMFFLVIPHRDERVFCEVGSLRTVVRMEQTP